ncbi:hypothetical protein SARC_18184 [Sphaeroforma arctica JP610]|uniref:Uncharacterized protein n=1 Tax=Sphaeroforma arctica JP610 TaxID=667725 RepID=A0A0L0EXY5_9EUKA|nr:hypothetical protein SARC_18184 [Sphaeroforma arctica JP610]KNC69306.1 hypothetical protein SARC_18184 [Sphaeroforma arctica JP610]|eukprot:XP_014143208.1 hypothetical protein SARC_18184 [Sphaeroforma arctica JP610]
MVNPILPKSSTGCIQVNISKHNLMKMTRAKPSAAKPVMTKTIHIHQGKVVKVTKKDKPILLSVHDPLPIPDLYDLSPEILNLLDTLPLWQEAVPDLPLFNLYDSLMPGKMLDDMLTIADDHYVGLCPPLDLGPSILDQPYTGI